MSETSPIALSDLLIDAENPRLPQPNVGQREALRAIAKHQGRKLQVLASDILKHGLNPTELSIVMPFEDDLRRYVVLEGNRRLTALKALENPEFLVDTVTAGVLSTIRRLSRDYQNTPIETVPCLIVKDREEARHWIELRHTGENDGAGIVPWGSDDKERFRARSGKIEVHTQALNFLEGRGALTPEARRNVPVTSFKRLIETPEVRAKLGFEVRGGKMKLLAGEKNIATALLYIAQDLASGKTKTEHIYTKEKRVQYANNLPGDIIVTPTRKPGHGVDVSEEASGSAGTKRATTARIAKRRDKLIPRDCVLNVVDARCRQIEAELRRLSLDNFTNAVSVLFRVFVELSADDYIGRMSLATSLDAKLSKKLQDVTADLVSRKKLSAQQAVPARRTYSKDSFLAPSVALMNEYVHNKHVFPSPADLRSYWDGLQPLFVAVWTP